MITGPFIYRDFRETDPWVGNKQQADGNTDGKQKMYSGLKYQINLSVYIDVLIQLYRNNQSPNDRAGKAQQAVLQKVFFFFFNSRNILVCSGVIKEHFNQSGQLGV